MSDSEERCDSDSDVQASDSDSDVDIDELNGEDDPYKCATPEEIPRLLEQLKADETEKFDEVRLIFT